MNFYYCNINGHRLTMGLLKWNLYFFAAFAPVAAPASRSGPANSVQPPNNILTHPGYGNALDRASGAGWRGRLQRLYGWTATRYNIICVTHTYRRAHTKREIGSKKTSVNERTWITFKLDWFLLKCKFCIGHDEFFFRRQTNWRFDSFGHRLVATAWNLHSKALRQRLFCR